MIKSIQLTNFQSHKKSTLNLSTGINVIIGSSDSGKTAILRALTWARYNRPVGSAFVSHWNQDKKGNPIDDTSVIVETSKHSINRTKTKGVNGYTVDGNFLEAVKTDVPEEVERAFNLHEVNFSRQMDLPFLLSESPGEVARFFNKIIRLDIIDRMLSTTESKKRKARQNLEAQEKIEENLAESIEELSWVEGAEIVLTKAERVSLRIEEKKAMAKELSEYVLNFALYAKQTKSFDWINKAEKKTVVIDEEISALREVKKERLKLSDTIETYNEQKAKLKRIPDLTNAENICVSIDDLIKKSTKKNESLSRLKDISSKLSVAGGLVTYNEKEIETLQYELPKECVLCGGKI
jgi:exonuclease SbcC